MDGFVSRGPVNDVSAIYYILVIYFLRYLKALEMKLKRLTVSVNLATALRSQTKSGMTILGVVVQFCRFFYLSAPSSAARHSCIRGKRNALEMKLKMLNSVVSVNLATALRSQTKSGMAFLGVVVRFRRFFFLSAPSSASRHSRVGGNLKALEMKLKMLNSVG